jgi:hypothetical protein
LKRSTGELFCTTLWIINICSVRTDKVVKYARHTNKNDKLNSKGYVTGVLLFVFTMKKVIDDEQPIIIIC